MARVDAGVLHLDRDLPAVRQHRPVDLPDARRGHRLRLQWRKMRSGSSPSSCRTTSAARLGAIGGASACSVASARCASSGSPSRMKLSSCPIFMSAPFIWPSSRAASSAVRMAKRASSSARRSSDAPARRTWLAVQSAPRRALSRHTRADRETRARSMGIGGDGGGGGGGRHRGGGRRDGCRTEASPRRFTTWSSCCPEAPVPSPARPRPPAPDAGRRGRRRAGRRATVRPSPRTSSRSPRRGGSRATSTSARSCAMRSRSTGVPTGESTAVPADVSCPSAGSSPGAAEGEGGGRLAMGVERTRCRTRVGGG